MNTINKIENCVYLSYICKLFLKNKLFYKLTNILNILKNIFTVHKY